MHYYTCQSERGRGSSLSGDGLDALDLLRYPQALGGMDNVATALFDLGHRVDRRQLAVLSAVVERTVVQCLGFLLNHLGHDELTGSMLESLRARGPLPWAKLDRQLARYPDFAPGPIQHDERLRVIARGLPEVNE